MTFDAKGIDEVKRQKGERRKALERMVRWAIKARRQCRNDQEKIDVFTVLLDSAEDVLDIGPKGGA